MVKLKKQKRIAQFFLKWLLVLVVIACVVTTVFLWFFQTELANQNADQLLSLNITDVQADIRDTTDEHLLEVVRSVAAELEDIDADTDAREALNLRIVGMLGRYDVKEINIINSEGIIVASNFSGFWDYDMASGEQSGEFMVLLDGEKEYVQEYQPVSYGASIERKYAGVVLKNGGFVQVGYDFEQFQKSVDEEVVALTRNRHVGSGGRILICDNTGKIVSNAKEIHRQKLDMASMGVKREAFKPGERFRAVVEGVPFYCMMEVSEGYYIIAVVPEREIIMTRNVVVAMAAAAEILVFIAFAALIYLLTKREIVDNVYRINDSLNQITSGNLNVVVDVRDNQEFDSLSNDINATVDTLKKYIADAAARIDAELAFAKAIQHSAMPSVFPAYPGRKEFDIHAAMYTAKEVGGDFYDFYFLDDDHLAFLVADVSGKGIPAAMFMMRSKTLLKSRTESGMSVEQVFTTANEELCEGNDEGMFVTAWMGLLNVKTGHVVFANAGHNPPLLRQGGGEYAYHKTRAGFVLAGMEGIRYRKFELQLEPGDSIYLYTDGVTEATDADKKLYGEERLLALMNSCCGVSARETCEAVKADVDRFVGEADQFDDITMLCLTWHGPQAEEAEA